MGGPFYKQTRAGSLLLSFCKQLEFVHVLELSADLLAQGIAFRHDRVGNLFSTALSHDVSRPVRRGGGLADLLIVKRVFTRTNTRIFMVILGNLLPSIALVWLSYESDPGQAFILMTAAVGLSGFVYSGYPAVTIDMSPKFSGVVYSVSNLIATFPGIISPLLTSSLTKHDTQEEWRSVFFIAASLYVLGMVVWSLFCSAELQPELNVGSAYEEIDGTIQKDESLLPVLRE